MTNALAGLAFAYLMCGLVIAAMFRAGYVEHFIDNARQALRLAPFDPFLSSFFESMERSAMRGALDGRYASRALLLAVLAWPLLLATLAFLDWYSKRVIRLMVIESEIAPFLREAPDRETLERWVREGIPPDEGESASRAASEASEHDTARTTAKRRAAASGSDARREER